MITVTFLYDNNRQQQTPPSYKDIQYTFEPDTNIFTWCKK